MKNELILSSMFLILVVIAVGLVSAEDIGYIAKDSSHIDSKIISLLDQTNYTYDVIFQTAFDSTNFSNYKMIIVGEGIYSNYTKIPVNKKNALILNSYYLDEWGWSKDPVSTMVSSIPFEMTILDTESPVMDGISEEFVSYNFKNNGDSYVIYYIPKNQDAPGLNTIVADDLSFLSRIGIYIPRNGAVVATISRGGELRNGVYSEARGIFLGFSETNLWNENTENIFFNSLNWTINGEDKDMDGYMEDYDCNDNAYDISPNETEIPYDGIDQNCDGYDLDDVDGDGFTAVIAGGDDCNDNDEEYNINSSDLSKNCVNDAPIIETIYRVSVHETENATVHVDAYDPENDEMTYSINDARFVQNGNQFIWETGYNDEGDYTFTATVSDGELQTEKEFNIKVWNRNKAPILTEDIPVQEWNEDTEHSLNLSQYFYDIDNDTIHYYASDTSDNLNTILKNITNGVAYFTSNKDWNGEDWIIFSATDLVGIQNTNNITLRVLPVNDAPKILENITSINIEEDETYNLNIENYIYDVDSILKYTYDNTTHTTIILDGNTLHITPEKNWYGSEETEIKAEDEEYEASQSFIINVISVNDAPVLENIENKIILAGDILEIEAQASDTEGDNITYSINDARFTKNENKFTWDSSEKDFGNYTFTISAYDGNNHGYTDVNALIMQKIWINEIYAGENSWLEIYNPENISFALDNCMLSDSDNNQFELSGTLGAKGYNAYDWYELDESDTIKLTCNEILIDEVNYTDFTEGKSYGRVPDAGDSWNVYDYPTKALSNSADVYVPVVNSVSPDNNSVYTETREINFEYTVQDDIDEDLECSLIVNDKTEKTQETENGTTDDFYIDYLSDGYYSWHVECSDGTNKGVSETRNTNISAPDNPSIESIPDKTTSENSKLSFIVKAHDSDGDKITLTVKNKTAGSNFSDYGNGTALFSWIPDYTQAGDYKIEFEATDDTGLKDSLTVNIKVNNAKEPPKFSDADVCRIKNDSIVISIKNPDSGDDYEIGDKIEGEVKIKNELDDDTEFEVKIYLYDITNEKVIEDTEGELDVDEGDSETLEFILDIPKDTENSEYAVYIYAENSDEECSSAYNEINIERKKHDVIIDKIKLDKEILPPGDEAEINVYISNLGEKDEDVTVYMSITGLNISSKSEEFQIEKYGDDDSETVTFKLNLPENTPEGTYTINAKVVYSDGENSSTKQFGVIKRVVAETVSNNIEEKDLIKLNSNAIKLSQSNSKDYAIKLQVEEDTENKYNPELSLVFGGTSDNVKTNKGFPWGIVAIVTGIGIIALFLIILRLK